MLLSAMLLLTSLIHLSSIHPSTRPPRHPHPTPGCAWTRPCGHREPGSCSPSRSPELPGDQGSGTRAEEKWRDPGTGREAWRTYVKAWLPGSALGRDEERGEPWEGALGARLLGAQPGAWTMQGTGRLTPQGRNGRASGPPCAGGDQRGPGFEPGWWGARACDSGGVWGRQLPSLLWFLATR